MSLSAIHQFLRCETPDQWVQNALANPDVLLIDHANCEKKAASTALHLMYRYVDNMDLLNKMSRLAREELRHFEQVIAIMEARGIPYRQITAARYAAHLHKMVATHEPQKLIDTLIIGAIIEARSCERFAKLAPFLDAELEKFYLSLLKSESRHFKDYLDLAQQASSIDISPRVDEFLDKERSLIESADTEFRFHSGPVVSGV
ncbi:tRNA isopentenyl-2-thiomethyl-A-37 hydroxylase MiaE [Aurantivibrio plasticivorans]